MVASRTSGISNRCSGPPVASSKMAGVTQRPEVVLADAGYWHHEQMNTIAKRGKDVWETRGGEPREGERVIGGPRGAGPGRGPLGRPGAPSHRASRVAHGAATAARLAIGLLGASTSSCGGAPQRRGAHRYAPRRKPFATAGSQVKPFQFRVRLIPGPGWMSSAAVTLHVLVREPSSFRAATGVGPCRRRAPSRPESTRGSPDRDHTPALCQSDRTRPLPRDGRKGRRMSHKWARKALIPNWWETHRDSSL